MKHSLWTHFQNSIDLDNFRGESQYLSQLHNTNKEQYEALYSYLKKIAPEFLSKMTEDKAFGVNYCEIDGRKITRDLLDSANELAFIDRNIGLKNLNTVLDIGAGYGRFTHRLYEVAPHIKSYCFDAIDVSTECCTKYLKYRNVPATVVPFDPMLSPVKADLAVNIHSWSECTREAISFWLQFLQDSKVSKIMVVPHTDDFAALEHWKEGGDTYVSYYDLFFQYGYREIVREKKFPVSVNGMYPTIYTIFELIK